MIARKLSASVRPNELPIATPLIWLQLDPSRSKRTFSAYNKIRSFISASGILLELLRLMIRSHKKSTDSRRGLFNIDRLQTWGTQKYVFQMFTRFKRIFETMCGQNFSDWVKKIYDLSSSWTANAECRKSYDGETANNRKSGCIELSVLLLGSIERLSLMRWGGGEERIWETDRREGSAVAYSRLPALLDAVSKVTLVVTPRDGRCGMRFCLFLLFIVCAWAGMLPGRPNLDRRTIRVLYQSLWLKSLSARQRRSAEVFYGTNCFTGSNHQPEGPGDCVCLTP